MQSLIKSFNMDRANFEAAKSVSPHPPATLPTYCGNMMIVGWVWRVMELRHKGAQVDFPVRNSRKNSNNSNHAYGIRRLKSGNFVW
jgi:hypothetical protein